ncbi:hypothetical protein BGW80DRAFT_1257744 [Lactifluus volemus]|nr:hypothetical protein BGW80DRAFT_1257744 [Lactifluus volemus]
MPGSYESGRGLALSTSHAGGPTPRGHSGAQVSEGRDVGNASVRKAIRGIHKGARWNGDWGQRGRDDGVGSVADIVQLPDAEISTDNAASSSFIPNHYILEQHPTRQRVRRNYAPDDGACINEADVYEPNHEASFGPPRTRRVSRRSTPGILCSMCGRVSAGLALLILWRRYEEREAKWTFDVEELLLARL